jgi:hypothetical protein
MNSEEVEATQLQNTEFIRVLQTLMNSPQAMKWKWMRMLLEEVQCTLKKQASQNLNLVQLKKIKSKRMKGLVAVRLTQIQEKKKEN